MTKRARRKLFSAAALALSLTCLGALHRDDVESWARHWYRSFDKWRTDHAMRQCCAELPAIDEVRLLHLEPLGSSPSLGSYTAPLYDREKMTIVAEKTIAGAEAQKFTKLWQKQVLHTWSESLCHEPHHVLQFRKDGKVVSEVVICFMCENVAIPRFPGWDLVSIAAHPPADFQRLQTVVESHVGGHVREKRK